MDDPEREAAFPTPIWRFRPTFDRAALAGLHDAAATWPHTRPGRERSNEGGWQSEADLHHLELLTPITNAVLAAATMAFADLGLDHLVPEITSCWLNVNHGGHANGYHLHGEAVLAAVFYLQAAGLQGRLVFLDPRIAAMTGPAPAKVTPINRRELPFEVRTGDLVLFPGWLLHRVERNGTDQPRATIAVNVRAAG